MRTYFNGVCMPQSSLRKTELIKKKISDIFVFLNTYLREEWRGKGEDKEEIIPIQKSIRKVSGRGHDIENEDENTYLWGI